MLRVGAQAIDWYTDQDPDGSIAFIKSCGYDTIDFNFNDYVHKAKQTDWVVPYSCFWDKPLEELYEYFAPIKEACKRHDVTIAQAHGPFPNYYYGNPELNEYLIGMMEKCLAVCAFLDCPGMVVHPVHGAGDDEWDCNMWMYRRLIPAAKKYGVKVLLENIFARFNGRFKQGRLSYPEIACEMFDTLTDEAGCDTFGFCFDVGHAIITCQDIPKFVRTLGHRLTNLHVHDNNGLDDLHMMPYSYLTTGDKAVCDWEGFVQALKDIAYRGAICFETFKTLRTAPKAIWPEILKLGAAIGHHWSDVILADDKNLLP